MRKVTSILLVLLMIAAMLRFTVATHYCGGHLAASKVSLTGELSNCGMEGSDKESSFPAIYFSKHCCSDVVAFFTINDNYIPSFSFIPEFHQLNLQVFAMPGGLSVNFHTDLVSQYSNVSPPGACESTDVDLTSICVFRI